MSSTAGLPIGMSLQPPTCERLADGVGKVATRAYFMERGVDEKTATAICAAVAAGTMADVVRLFERCVKARTASLCDAVGDPVGSLGGSYKRNDTARPCECCGQSTTTG